MKQKLLRIKRKHRSDTGESSVQLFSYKDGKSQLGFPPEFYVSKTYTETQHGPEILRLVCKWIENSQRYQNIRTIAVGTAS